MLTIDAHCHASSQWFEPVELLLLQMSRNAVDKSVLVQHEGQYDNRYLLECVRRFPGRFCVVGLVDTTAPDGPEALTYWASEGIRGVRLGPSMRSPGSDPLAVWRKASELGLVVSAHGTSEEYASDEFRRLIEALPDLPIIIEHLGFVGSEGGPAYTSDYANYRKILALSRYPNTYMKVPGLGEFMPRPMPAREPPFDLNEVPPVIDMAIEAFGPNRLMLGTDYPPCSRREGYGNVVYYVREYLSRHGLEVQKAIFGGTAASLFSFDDA